MPIVTARVTGPSLAGTASAGRLARACADHPPGAERDRPRFRGERMTTRGAARMVALAAALLFAGTAAAETVTLVCTFVSTDPAEAKVPLEKAIVVDFDRRTVDGRPARIDARAIAWDIPGAGGGDVTTTTVSRFSGQMSVTSNVAGELFVGRCAKPTQ
jgi:hypothetical protein